MNWSVPSPSDWFCLLACNLYFFFFFNDTATTEIYTLSLHDALPIYARGFQGAFEHQLCAPGTDHRSEEHTSELQSLAYLVCRLLLEKKKIKLIQVAAFILIDQPRVGPIDTMKQ